MLPIFDPALLLFEPVALGLEAVAAVGATAMLVVAGLVARAGRRPARPRATVTPIRPHLDAAA